MEQNVFLAVMGSPASGKTITSIKIALELAKQKKNVIIVSLDTVCQTIPIVSSMTHEISLGTLLTKMELTQSDILSACVPVNEYVSVLGYKLGDNASLYPKILPDKVKTFFVNLSHIADYVIIDCMSNILADVSTIIALEMADIVLKLATADLKSISYFYTVDKMLVDKKFNQSRTVFAINNVHSFQDAGKIMQQLEREAHILPGNSELAIQCIEQGLFEDLSSKSSRQYSNMIIDVVKDIYSDEILLSSKKESKAQKSQFAFKKNKSEKNKVIKQTSVEEIQVNIEETQENIEEVQANIEETQEVLQSPVVDSDLNNEKSKFRLRKNNMEKAEVQQPLETKNKLKKSAEKPPQKKELTPKLQPITRKSKKHTLKNIFANNKGEY